MVKVQGASTIIVIVLTVTTSAEASLHQWSPEEVDQTTLGSFL